MAQCKGKREERWRPQGAVTIEINLWLVMVDTNPKIFEPNLWIHIQGNLKRCSRRPWINILFNLEVLHDGIPMLRVNGTPRPPLLDLQVQSD